MRVAGKIQKSPQSEEPRGTVFQRITEKFQINRDRISPERGPITSFPIERWLEGICEKEDTCPINDSVIVIVHGPMLPAALTLMIQSARIHSRVGLGI
jgi:hypothetical protein